MVAKLDNKDLEKSEMPEEVVGQEGPKSIDPKTEITITIEELQTLIQAERLAALASSISNKVNNQLR